jgi:hypothetical protein
MKNLILIIILFTFASFSANAQSYGETNLNTWIGLIEYMANNNYATISPPNISRSGCTLLMREIRRLNNLGYSHHKAATYVQGKLGSNDMAYQNCKMAYPSNFHLMCGSYVGLGGKYTRQSTMLYALYTWERACN